MAQVHALGAFFALVKRPPWIGPADAARGIRLVWRFGRKTAGDNRLAGKID